MKISLSILLLCILKVSSYDYEKQIIVILEENDKTADHAAYNLWGKDSCDDDNTQIVKWLPDSQTTLGKSFQVVKWDDKTEWFIPHEKHKTWELKDNMKTRIQVIGHGRISGDVTRMAGFTHDKLAKMLSTLVEPGTKNVGRISLVGCSLFGNEQRSCKFSMQRNDFSVNLLESLRGMGIKTEISARTGQVGISSSGKKVHGQQARAGDDLKWLVKEGSVKKVLLKHTESGELDVRYVSYKAMNPYIKGQPLGKGDNVKEYRIEIEEESQSGSVTSYVTLDNEESFQVLTSAAEMVFNGIVVPNNWDEQITKPVKVQMSDGTVRNLPVRKLRGIMDLTREIKHWGALGFEYPRKDENGQKISTAKDGQPFIDKKVYFQFGKFILSLNVQAEKFSIRKLNPFYINFVGIIAPKLSDLKGDNPRITVPNIGNKVDYPNILPRTNDDFFPDVIQFLRGDNDNIKTGTANAYNALAAMAVFLSEPIRDWRQHIINILMLDLYHNLPRQEFGRNIYFLLHPMARGGTGPAKFSGMRYKLYQGNCWTKKKIKKQKAMFAHALEKWVSADFKDTSRGIYKRPQNSQASKSSSAHRGVIKKKFADTLEETLSKFVLDKGTGFIHPQQGLSLTDVTGPLIHPIDNEFRVTAEEDVWLPFSNNRALRSGLSNPFTTNIVDCKELERENQRAIVLYKRQRNKSAFDIHTGILTSHDVWASTGREYVIRNVYSTSQQAQDIYLPIISGGFGKK